jgi:erythronate-4-phosphate dehydrogenase
MITDDVVYIRGSEICQNDLKDADALIVRTRTRCDSRLLEGTNVQFVATATIGFDHIDTDYLQSAGISWMSCPGCNAASVAQYINSTLLVLGIDLESSVLGVVGCGHVGSLVKAVGEQLGMSVMVSDPPLGRPDFVSLEEIASKADVITFHVPLDGTTHYMAGKRFFSMLRKKPWIINSSRGGVVDERELIDALDIGVVRGAVVDTWENEPSINTILLNKVYIGTPHIAGYSADGKVNADNMVIEGLCRHFGIPNPGKIMPPPLPSDFVYTGNPLQLYNPLDDSIKLKRNPDDFERLRGDYPLRREKAEIVHRIN